MNTSPWWLDAVVYEVYVRSFADGNGDGTGDLAGLRSRLDHLTDLGVDAIWLTPFYRSPMADGGYDVADYRDVDPLFGTLADADALIADAHARGLRLIVDIVPNHTSDAHPWFAAALAAGPGSPARERYVFRDGRGPGGTEPPNDWRSNFGGPAWTRVPDGQWYLHLFAPEQPDLNWRDPAVHREFEEILRFWLDRGVDGFRIDVAMGLFKHPDLPDLGDPALGGYVTGSPIWGRPEVHEIYRSWRRILDGYDGERMAIGEVWTDSADALAHYLRPDELHQAFNFHLQLAPWDAARFREVVDDSLRTGTAPTWVLSSHDSVRHPTRYGGGALGLARARAALLFVLALPGSVYLYQGEELGLPEVEDLPDEARQDPIWTRMGGTLPGRDGCRVPLPWSGRHSPYGFTPDGVTPWLPMPAMWDRLSVAAQTGDPYSNLAFYRQALARRRELRGTLDGEPEWLPAAADVLVFRRDTLICAVNFGTIPAALPAHDEVLLASAPLDGDRLPGGAAAWLR